MFLKFDSLCSSNADRQLQEYYLLLRISQNTSNTGGLDKLISLYNRVTPAPKFDIPFHLSVLHT